MRRRALLALVLVALVAVVAVVAVVAGSGDDDDDEKATFHTEAEAQPFAGPVPLTVKFSVDPQGQSGDVKYRWKFEDGTTSEEQNPTHTFTRAGYYTVTVDAIDEEGKTDRQNMLLGAWPQSTWSAAQKRARTSPTQARKLIRDQQRRTNERKRELAQKARESEGEAQP